MAMSFVANGNINPSRFCKLDTTAENKVLICGAGDLIWGISQEGTRYPPGYGSVDDGYRAIAGENITLYTANDECWLESGAAVTRGDNLKANASGQGIVQTAENDNIGAVALETASGAGKLIRVKVLPPQLNQ